MRVWHGRGMSADIKQALRLALCFTNPSALPGARWLFLSLIEKRIPAGSTNALVDQEAKLEPEINAHVSGFRSHNDITLLDFKQFKTTIKVNA